MKLACQERLVQGTSLEEKLNKLAMWGYEGVEFWGSDWLLQNIPSVQKAVEKAGLKVSTVCAGYKGSVLDPDPNVRKQTIVEVKDRLTACSDLGAVGLIFVPIFGQPKLPDLSPYKNAVDLERELLLTYLDELGKHAEKVKANLLLEPLNRYETHFLRRVEQTVEFCEQVGNPFIGVMADFFHMNIEESSIPDAIRKGNKWIKHVHLADSNRLLPGWGHMDFRKGFLALKEIGFNGFMALECDIPDDPDKTIPQSARYLREWML